MVPSHSLLVAALLLGQPSAHFAARAYLTETVVLPPPCCVEPCLHAWQRCQRSRPVQVVLACKRTAGLLGPYVREHIHLQVIVVAPPMMLAIPPRPPGYAEKMFAGDDDVVHRWGAVLSILFYTPFRALQLATSALLSIGGMAGRGLAKR